MDFREFVGLAGLQIPFDDLSPEDKVRILGAMSPELTQEIEALNAPPIPQELKDRFDHAIKVTMNRP